eukprot:g2127.t1
MFNARSETVLTKGVFSRLMSRRRCAVPLSGFYEWQDLSSCKKQPFYLTATKCSEEDSTSKVKKEKKATRGREMPIVFVAALYDTWRDETTGVEIHSFTMLTMPASSVIAEWLHARQPVFLDTDSLSEWIDCAEIDSSRAIKAALQSGSRAMLSWRPVTMKMTNPRYEGSDCSKHVDETSSSIKKWFGASSASASDSTVKPEKIEQKKRASSFVKKSPSASKKPRSNSRSIKAFFSRASER